MDSDAALHKLYLHRGSCVFGGVEYGAEEPAAVIIGAPLELTTSYKPGTRFAPDAIRRAAANIEFYSLRAGLDLDTVPILDLGDIAVAHDMTETLKRIETVARGIAAEHPPGRVLHIYLGGEHTVTLGLARGYGYPCVLSFDAHFDLRDEYLGAQVGHATYARRLVEEAGPRIGFIGVRAFTSEELAYAREKGLPYVDVLEARRDPRTAVHSTIKELVERSNCRHLHVTLDIDVYDPAYAPGVGNPEPEGLGPAEIFEAIHEAVKLAKHMGISLTMDIVEVSPPNDCNDVTSVLAAKTVVEAVAAWLREAGNG